jgi:hypothetical protein
MHLFKGFAYNRWMEVCRTCHLVCGHEGNYDKPPKKQQVCKMSGLICEWRQEMFAFNQPEIIDNYRILNQKIPDTLYESQWYIKDIEQLDLKELSLLARHMGLRFSRDRSKLIKSILDARWPTQSELLDLKVDELKEICRCMQARVSGRKQELIDRIHNNWPEFIANRQLI